MASEPSSIPIDLAWPRLARLATVAALVTTAACASVPPATVTTLNPRPKVMPARPMASVIVYTLGVPAGAVEVYLIRVGDDDNLDQADRLYNARWTAARLGCDGLVIREDVPDQRIEVSGRRGGSHTPIDTVHGTVTTQGHVTAVCIAWPVREVRCPSCEPPMQH